MLTWDEFAIVYLLPEAAARYHLDLWSKVEAAFHLTGERRPKSPPHITLKYPFAAVDLAAVETMLAGFVDAVPPAPMAIRGFNRFITPDNYVIFLDVIPSSAARTVHARLLKRLKDLSWMTWGQYDTADMHFHVTIAEKGQSEAAFGDLWAFVNSQPAPDFALHLDHLALVKIGKNDVPYRTFQTASADPADRSLGL